MKFLVLGSSGQIGSPLCSFLRNKGHIVKEWDIKLGSKYDLRIFNFLPLEQFVMESDFVFFLAWDVGGSKYLLERQDKFEFIDNNISMMKNVFDVLKKYQKPFIFSSSQMSLISDSSYGNLKMIGEKYTNSLNGLNVRLWNVFGKEKEEDKAHVITDFIKMAKQDNVISMMTNGKEERQFLHVDDCCEAFYLLCSNYEKFSCEKYIDVSNFEWCSIERIAKIISNFYNCSYKKGNKTDRIQNGHKCDPDNFILKFWKPLINIEDGIERLCNEFDASK